MTDEMMVVLARIALALERTVELQERAEKLMIESNEMARLRMGPLPPPQKPH